MTLGNMERFVIDSILLVTKKEEEAFALTGKTG